MSTDRVINVIIADDHEFFRDGLAGVLSSRSDIHLVAQASNGEELIEQVAAHLPDLVITDLTMPIKDGIEAAKIIKQQFPSTKVIALSMHNDDYLILSMMKAGAMGFVDKTIRRDDLFFAIDQVVFHNTRYVTETVERMLLMEPIETYHGTNVSTEIVFSERELQVIKMLIEELTIKEMADALGLSVKTIESHRARIMKRMNVKSMAGVVGFAFNHHLI